MRTILLALALLAPIENLDWNLQHRVQHARSSAWEHPMRTASDIGKPWLVGVVMLAIGAIGGPAGRIAAATVVVALIPTNLMVEGLKWSVGRTRPDGDRKRSNSSFPSSHAANAFAIATVLGWRWRRVGILLWIGAMVVAFSRVYLNRHFVSDVVAGAAIGIAFGVLAVRWIDARSRRARPASA